MSKAPQWVVFVFTVAVAICVAFQYFYCRVARPGISSLSGVSGKVLHANENVAEVVTNRNKEKSRAMNRVSGTLPTNGGIWHVNYTSKDDTGTNLVGLWPWRIMNKSYVEEHLDGSQIGDYICEDALCSELLTERDLKQVNRCVNRFIKRPQIRERGETLVPTCHFINGTSRASKSKVALISFPGSGNTWIRGLLEKATGICTGEEQNSHS